MKLVLLGSTGYHPNESRHTLCAMLPELGIVLDAGTGMFRVRERIQTPALDIFLTHAHLDHIVGLTYLFDVLHDKQVERVSVHGQQRVLDAVQRHLLAEPLFPAPLPCDYRELPQAFPLPGGGTLTHFPLVHPGGSIGFRLDWPGHSLGFVTDTTAAVDAPYVAAIAGVDLLVHECYFSDEQRELAIKTGHSHATPVAQVARAANVGRLVLVHANPLVDMADPIGMAAFKGLFSRVEMGFDGQELVF
jgi:ribonuclease BN (tRNA processing enzyme)